MAVSLATIELMTVDNSNLTVYTNPGGAFSPSVDSLYVVFANGTTLDGSDFVQTGSLFTHSAISFFAPSVVSLSNGGAVLMGCVGIGTGTTSSVISCEWGTGQTLTRTKWCILGGIGHDTTTPQSAVSTYKDDTASANSYTITMISPTAGNAIVGATANDASSTLVLDPDWTEIGQESSGPEFGVGWRNNTDRSVITWGTGATGTRDAVVAFEIAAASAGVNPPAPSPMLTTLRTLSNLG